MGITTRENTGSAEAPASGIAQYQMGLYRMVGLLAGGSQVVFASLFPPEAHDPMWLRWIMFILAAGAVGLTFVSEAIRKNIALLSNLLVIGFLTWTVAMVLLNDFHPAYSLTLLVVIPTACLTFSREIDLYLFGALWIIGIILALIWLESRWVDIPFFCSIVGFITVVSVSSNLIRLNLLKQKSSGEQQMKSLFLNSPDAQLVVDPISSLVVDCNPGAASLLEASQHQVLIGKSIRELLIGFFTEVPFETIRRGLFETGKIQRKVTLGTLQGKSIETDTALQEVMYNARTHWLIRITDITTLSNAEAESRFLIQLPAEIREKNTIHEALEYAVRRFCEISGWVYGEAWHFNPRTSSFELQASYDSGNFSAHEFLVASRDHQVRKGLGVLGTVFETGKSKWIKDLRQEPNFRRGAMASRAGFETMMVSAVKCGDRIIAMLVFFHFRSRQQDFRFFNLLNSLSAQFGDVLEQKENEEALRVMNERHRLITEASYQGICVYRNNKIVEVNNAFAMLFGYKPSEMIGMEVMDLVHPDSHAEVEKRIQDRNQDLYEVKSVRKDGSVFSAEVLGRTLVEFNTEVRVVAARDITQRKKAETLAQQAQANETIQAYLENSSEALMVVSDQGQIIYMSPGSVQVLGAPADKFTGKMLFPLAPDEDQSLLKNALSETASVPGKKINIQARFRNASGELRMMQMGFRNMMQDPRVGGIFISARDITESLEAEKGRQESEERFRNLFLQSPDAIFVEDESGMVLDANEAAAEMHEMTREQLIGTNIIDLIPAESQQEVKSTFYKWFTGELTYLESTGLTISGKPVPVEIRAQRLKYKGKNAVLFHVRDITKRIESQRKLEESRARLQYHNQQLKKITTSHGLTQGDLDPALKEIVKVAVETLNIARSSIWFFNEDRTAIVCKVLYDSSTGEFSSGTELMQEHFPAYFKALEEERVINASLARTDPVTSDFTEVYLKPLDIFSMLDAPIRYHGIMVGVICNEQVGSIKFFTPEEETFASAMGDLIAMSLERSDRESVARNLAQSASMLQATFDSSPDGIIIVSPAGDVLSYNQVFLNIWNFTHEELKDPSGNYGFDEAMKKIKDPHAFSKVIEEMRQRPGETSYDLVEFREGGIFERHSRPLLLQDKIIGRIWVFHDITRRVRVESALRKAERRMKSLLNAIPDMMLRVNDEGKILDVKAGALIRLFPDATSLHGRNISRLFHKNLAEKFQLLIRESIENPMVRNFEFNVRLHGELVDLEARFVRSGASEVLAILRDVTERKRSEQELIRRNFELDSFVYRASHDLKSPLNSLQGLITLMKNNSPTDESSQYLQLMDKSVYKLEGFIRDLADFSRNTRMELIRTRIDFNELLKDTEENLRFMENSETIEKKFFVSGSPVFYSDPVRLGIVLNNLLSNAIKYQKIGGENNQVSISVVVTEKEATITVSDNGIGISAEHLDKIFNLFFRASVQATGTGLGLYIVKTAVEKIKGSIAVESTPGQGTTFTVVAPNLKQEVESAEEIQTGSN